MECVVGQGELISRFKFCCKGKKQRLLIDVLLKYSGIAFNELTKILHVSDDILQDVYSGKRNFEMEDAENLILVFLMYFSD